MDGDGHASREAAGTVIGANAVREGIPRIPSGSLASIAKRRSLPEGRNHFLREQLQVLVAPLRVQTGRHRPAVPA